MPRVLLRWFTFEVVAIAAGFSVASAQVAATRPEVGITHVDVIDVVTGAVLTDQTVVIDGNRISTVGPAATVRLTPLAQVVDGRGKFLIPGLWDMHAHVIEGWLHDGADNHALSFPLYLANGVTGVRDMWTTVEGLAKVRAWNRAEHARELAGPRVVPTGTMLTGPAPTEENTIVVTTAEQAVHVVDSLVAAGVRTLKVQDELSREVYFAIATRARKDGVDFVGHVTAAVTAREAADAGQHSIEHDSGVNDGCSRQEAEIMRRRSQGLRDLGAFIHETYDDSTCRALARLFVERGTWLDPTTIVRSFGLADDSLRTKHRGYPYAPAAMRTAWAARPAVSPARMAQTRANIARSLEIVGLMSRNGVGILAGTDDGNPWLYHGFSLQDELALMTTAGLTPLEALRTATLNPARFFHATDSLGTVSPGRLADLVLLDANPLADIHNTQRISAVFADGRYFDRVALDALLVEATRVADAMK